MEWMWNAFWAWIGWNILAPVMASIFLLFVLALFRVSDAMRRRRCKHERFHETRSCDAICIDCGMNLGFIGTMREQRAKLQDSHGSPLKNYRIELHKTGGP
jgi:hypothetical protein